MDGVTTGGIDGLAAAATAAAPERREQRPQKMKHRRGLLFESVRRSAVDDPRFEQALDDHVEGAAPDQEKRHQQLPEGESVRQVALDVDDRAHRGYQGHEREEQEEQLAPCGDVAATAAVTAAYAVMNGARADSAAGGPTTAGGDGGGHICLEIVLRCSGAPALRSAATLVVGAAGAVVAAPAVAGLVARAYSRCCSCGDAAVDTRLRDSARTGDGAPAAAGAAAISEYTCLKIVRCRRVALVVAHVDVGLDAAAFGDEGGDGSVGGGMTLGGDVVVAGALAGQRRGHCAPAGGWARRPKGRHGAGEGRQAECKRVDQVVLFTKFAS